MGDLRLEHDDQLSSGICTHCGAPFDSVIGVMYEDDDPIAIYRADIFDHFHREPQPRVVLSIAVGDWSDGTGRTDRCSAAIEAWADGDRVQMAFSDRAGSPWQELEVVSWQLSSAEAQAGPLRDAFLRLADHIAYQDRRLRRALTPARRQSQEL
ncbi:MAG: hypothetical protein E6I58_07115 [Chloroflexi bacterium]|nr:MAG: hypothetical protein E6J05_06115 [Chloroflexota bacterium]TME56743.1 MAG: hypothetical protein E6I58_07115 [Chloroflexota bacterium]